MARALPVSDLAEMDYATVARGARAATASASKTPGAVGPALEQGIAERDGPTVIDVVVTRDPAKMLPAVDNRTVQVGRATGSRDAVSPGPRDS